MQSVFVATERGVLCCWVRQVSLLEGKPDLSVICCRDGIYAAGVYPDSTQHQHHIMEVFQLLQPFMFECCSHWWYLQAGGPVLIQLSVYVGLGTFSDYVHVVLHCGT